jgi:hypothetical protein
VTLKKYEQESFSVIMYYYESFMLISQTVDFIKILEFSHRLIMGVKILTHLSQVPKRLLKIWAYPIIEGVKGYNRLNHTIEAPLKIDPRNGVWKFLKMENLNFYHVTDIWFRWYMTNKGRSPPKLSNSEKIIALAQVVPKIQPSKKISFNAP